jgi:cysteine peptidase B
MGYVTFILLSIAVLLEVLKADDFDGNRYVRDDGSFMKDSGGPVAQVSKNEATQKSEFANVPGIDKLDPCEVKASKLKGKGKGGKGGKLKISKKGLKSMVKKGHHAGGKNGGSDKGPSAKEIKEEFEKFKKEHGKSYSNPAEQAQAMKTFGDNLAKMQKLMAARKSVYDASFSMTKHSDMTFLDFLTKMGGYIPDIEFPPIFLDPKALTAKRDCKFLHWPKYDVIPDVRLQENCGSCYAHTAADLIGSQYAIDNKEWGKNYKLSTQYLVDCMSEPKAFGCKGGRSADMMNYLAQCDDCAIPLEDDYKYEDKKGQCQKPGGDKPPIKVKWAYSFDISGPFEKELMAALLQHGPVVAIVGVTDGWQLYNGTGIFKFYQCTMKQAHAVLIVGYNYTSCVPTYFVKNSWGDDWGGRGAIKLEAGKNTCSVAKTVIAVCTADDCPKSKAEYLSYILSHPNYPDCT